MHTHTHTLTPPSCSRVQGKGKKNLWEKHMLAYVNKKLARGAWQEKEDKKKKRDIYILLAST
jgi:hypothetical protein